MRKNLLKVYVSLKTLTAPKKTEAEEKNVKLDERKEEKNNCLSSFHTEDCCTTDYQYHSSLPPRDRERDRDRDRDFVVVVVKKKKKTTTGFEREKRCARDEKNSEFWGNSI